MQVVYKSIPRRSFGVEFEVSNNVSKQHLGQRLREYEKLGSGRDVVVTPGVKGWAQTDANAYWHVKYDSTCGPKGKGRDSGWEVASYIARGSRDIQNISRAASFLSLAGAEVNSNCGLHIHANAADFSFAEMGVLLARWLKVEWLLTAICDETRRNNKYCRPLRWRWLCRMHNHEYHPEYPAEFCDIMLPTNLSAHDNDEKKVTLNIIGWTIGQILSFYPRKTVELRLPEARLEEQHVRYWVTLFLHFVHSCKGVRIGLKNLEPVATVNEGLELLGLYGTGGKFFLFDEQLLDAKLWFLNKVAAIDDRVAQEATDLIDFISEI